MKFIKLTQNQFTLVDDGDFEKFNKVKWYATWDCNNKNFYARRSGPRDKNRKQHPVMLHRIILGLNDPNIKVDHKNRETLDNRKQNLRICTNSQNSANRKGPQINSTSGFRGVSWRQDTCKWWARISVAGKNKNLGFFTKKSEAISAYAKANRKYYGDFGGTF